MTEPELHGYALLAHFALGAVTFAALWFVTAPYGRHVRGGWGPAINQRLAWVLMELPAVGLWAFLYFLGRHRFQPGPLGLLFLWQLHYVTRTFVFPFRIRAAGKTTPLSIVALAVVFNTLNAYVNARWVSELGCYPIDWLTDPRFLAGAACFLVGFGINQHADTVLMRLRRPGETGYKIPYGGLYRFISCPNYFGEMLEWTGFALASWSLPGLAFALYTVANLAPRAVANHRWYRAKFPDYPKERRALLPFLL